MFPQSKFSLNGLWSNPTTVRFVSLLLFAVMAFVLFGFRAEDANIVGRYAQNVADGNGLVYNAGANINALTSPLHGLVSTGLALLGVDQVLVYRVLSPIIVALAIVWSAQIAGLSGRRAVFFYIFTLTSPFVVLWSVGGLETPLLTAVLTLFAAVLIRAQKRGSPSNSDFIFLGVLAGLAFLGRFDTALVFGPIFLAYIFVYRSRPFLWIGGAVAALIAFGWLGFAYSYFDDVFPTSAYIKLLATERPRIDNFMAIGDFLIVFGLVLLIPFHKLRPFGAVDSNPVGIAMVIAAILLALYATVASAQHMMFGYRFFVPYIPIVGFFLAFSDARLPNIREPMALTFNVLVLATMIGLGLNVTVIGRLTDLSKSYPEYGDMRLDDYVIFMDTLKEDALEIAAHWEQNKVPGEQPTIALYTAGMGYHLPEFFVFEELASLRVNCGNIFPRGLRASHYVQDLSVIGINDVAIKMAGERLGGLGSERISYSTVKFDDAHTVGYRFSPNVDYFRPPPRIFDPC